MDETLEVRIVLHAGLRTGGVGTVERSVSIRRGTTLAAVLEGLGVELGLVGVASSAGRLIPLGAALTDRCTVEVYPLVGGG